MLVLNADKAYARTVGKWFRLLRRFCVFTLPYRLHRLYCTVNRM